MDSPLGCGRELLSTEADRPRYQKLCGLGLDQHGGLCCSISDPSCMGHVADNVSRSRVHHRSGGRKCQGQAGGGADAAGGERGRKSAAGRNPVKGFPSRVWKGSQVSHLWLNRRSLGIDRLDPITRPLSWLGQQTVGTHPRTKGALRITGGPPAGRRIPMGSLIVLEQEHQATHGEGKRRGRNTSTTLKSRKHRTS